MKKAENALKLARPDLADEWADSKDINTVTIGSQYKAQWKCSDHPEHQWSAIVASRATRGAKCPYCTNRKVLSGFNDLATTHPELAKEWDDEREISTTTSGSGYKARWKCLDHGHSFSMTIASRAKSGHSCPVCSNKVILTGFNDIATVHPELVDEWDDDVDIATIGAGNTKSYSWRCRVNHAHQWKASAANRSRGTKCPYCSGLKTLSGERDLLTTHPVLAEEWADEKSVDTVSAGSKYEAKWLCALGHVYTMKVVLRVKGQGCAYCAGKRVLVGYNDLMTHHPELVDEWDDEREMSSFTRVSTKVVKWKCKDFEDHKWEMKIGARTASGLGCVYCSGRSVMAGFNDLATTHPELAQEWDDERDIATIKAGMVYRPRWKCAKGHEWYALLQNRIKKDIPTGCPNCAFSDTVSKPEGELYQSIVDMLPVGTKVTQSFRNLIPPFEVDIYVPEKKIAIEFNGIYWHSEAGGKDSKYHYEKFVRCRDQGVQLIQIWEDDFKRNPELVKKMIGHKLGVLKSKNMFARNTKFKKTARRESEKFLELNHLQGFHGVSRDFGLVSKNARELVAVMSVKRNKKDNSLEISRFASSCVVPGGFTKLLSNILRQEEYREIEKVISYSHNDHSWGQVYKQNGFTKVHDGKPGYFYVVNNQREHRLGFSSRQFRERSDLIFEEGKTERELALLNGLTRAWDSGSALWSKKIK